MEFFFGKNTDFFYKIYLAAICLVKNVTAVW